MSRALARAKRQRALTLPEVLVGASLSLVLGVTLLQVFAPLMRSSARTAQRLEMQQRALVALQQMSTDLALTTYGGVTARSAPGVLGLVPLRTVTGDGTAVWDSKMIVYSLRGGRLLRRELGSSGGGLSLTGQPPVRLDPLLLDQLAAPDGSERVVAEDVVRFEIGGVAGAVPIASPITLHLALERPSPTRKEAEHFELSRTVICKQPL